MDERKHPKRRKHKDNPYTIYESDKHYYVSFSDGQGKVHTLEIEKSVYDMLDRFELDDLAQLNEYDRHIEHSEIFEETLDRRATADIQTLEETVFQQEEYRELHKAIQNLSEIQRRRLILYYFCGWKYEKIAKVEGCTTSAISYSISIAEKNLKKFLKQT